MARKNESAVVVGDARRKWFGRKQIVLLVLIIIVLVAAAVIGTTLWHNHQHNLALKNQREAVVTQAAPYLDADNFTKLAPFADKIKQQPGYATDPDSLYVLTMYYLNATDPQNAKTYYTALTKYYDTNVGYTNKALKGAQTPTQLKSYYDLVQQQATSFYSGKFPGKP